MAIDLGVHNLRAAYREGTLACRTVIEDVLARIAGAGDDKVWISRIAGAELLDAARALDDRRNEIAKLPLFGIPFAVKDNIDVAGLPTTAGCPSFAYQPEQPAEVVRQLVNAGAVMVGKTNLDQFATGLAGVRSPYGVPRNPFNADYIPGGSSSGSAVAVASGLVSFALGTDTAGSGRVPAGFNNIVGLKPAPGLVSTDGIVPACRSLDCVSILALSAADAASVLAAVAPSRPARAFGSSFRFGVPRPVEFFGDTAYAALYVQAVEKLRSLGGVAIEFDYAPFRDAAQLLYGGPWVAERTAAVGAFLERDHDDSDVWPLTRQIILGGREYSAVDTFEGQYELAELKARAEREMRDLDFLALPTAATIYTLNDLELEPLLYNSNLGHYTNFVNLFGMSAISLPAGFRADRLPFGITLVARPFAEAALLAFGARWQRAHPLPLGKTASCLPPAACDPAVPEDRMSIAVVGAHMSGLPLNHQLGMLGGRLEKATATAPLYRLYALAGGPPPRPGLVRVAAGGGTIALEVWSLPSEQVGAFAKQIPAPLGLGSVLLADGSSVTGFLCESYATEGARDITAWGGWRAYLKSLV